MKKVAFYSKPLDDSNGTVKNVQNNAMQPASQTTENGQTEKKSPLNRIGLFAILAVGVDAAASFLKSKMEKAAAVASQVAAAVSESKKMASAAAAAVFVRIQPEPPKKARLTSAIILALLAGIFAVQNQGMAVPRSVWLPEYEEHYYSKITHILVKIPFLGQRRVPTVEPYIPKSALYSQYVKPSDTGVVGTATKHYYRSVGPIGIIKEAITTTHFLSLNGKKSTVTVTTHFSGWRNQHQRTVRGGRHNVNLVYHTKVGEMTTIITNLLNKQKFIEKWKNNVYFHETQRMEGGPFEFSVRFGAINAFGFTVESEFDDLIGYCEAGRISAYPGPSTSVSPCVPSNLSMPSNGYLTYYSVEARYVPTPDDDDE